MQTSKKTTSDRTNDKTESKNNNERDYKNEKYPTLNKLGYDVGRTIGQGSFSKVKVSKALYTDKHQSIDLNGTGKK